MQVLEDKVNVMGGQVADGAARIVVIEEQLNRHECTSNAPVLNCQDMSAVGIFCGRMPGSFYCWLLEVAVQLLSLKVAVQHSRTLMAWELLGSAC